MSNLLLLAICLGLGMLFKKYKVFPEKGHESLNVFVLQVSLPAATLFYVPNLTFGWSSVILFVTSLIVFLLGSFVFTQLGAWLRWPREVVGCLILVCGLGNTSFVGFPLVEAFYGKDGLQYAVLIDQGSFLVVSILGISTAAAYTSHKADWGVIRRRVFSFPAFWAFLLGIILGLLHIRTDNWLFLEKLAGTITPLALLSVGLQFELRSPASDWQPFCYGLAYKLLLAPIVVWLLYAQIGLTGLPLHVAVMEAGMAPMITATLLASQQGLRPALANMLLGIGILASLGSVWLWFWVHH